MDEVSLLITQKLETMVENPEPALIRSKSKAMSALFPYAMFLEQGGQRRMVDAISHTARAARPGKFMWYHAKPFVTAMFNKPNPPSLTWVLGLISPRVWQDEPQDKDVIAGQVVVASAVSRLGQGGWSVADELLRIAFVDSIHPHIPHGFPWRPKSTAGDLTQQVEALGDIRILKSYLLLVWSKWGPIDDQSGGFSEMRTSIREHFSGIGMGHHREDLVERLDYILQELDWTYRMERREGFRGGATQRKGHCEEFKRVLLEVDEEAVNTLTRMSLTLTRFGSLTPTDAYRIPPDVRVRSAPPVSLISYSGNLGLLSPAIYLVCTSASIVVTIPRSPSRLHTVPISPVVYNTLLELP